MHLLWVVPKPQPPELRLWEYVEVNNHMCFVSRKDIANFTFTMKEIFKYNISLQIYSEALINVDSKED